MQEAVAVGLEKERRQDHEHVRAQAGKVFGELDGAAGAGGAAGGDQGDAAVDVLGDSLHELDAFGGLEGVAFACVAEEAEAVGALFEQEVDEAKLAGDVERTVLVKGGNENGEDAGQHRSFRWYHVYRRPGLRASYAVRRKPPVCIAVPLR